MPGMTRAAPAKKRRQVDDRRHLVVLHRVDRLAAVQRLELGEVVGLRLDAVGELQEQSRRARHGVVRDHVAKAFSGRGDGRVDLAPA